MELIQGHRPERSCQMNIFKEIERTRMYFRRKGNDSIAVTECCSIDDHYTNNIDRIYAAYLLGYRRGRNRGAKNAIAKRPNNASC